MLVEERDTRTVRREATRARILDAAWRIARRDGLAALSLRDIAREVGMRAPSLYNYFPSKNAIYDAMYADGLRELVAAVWEPSVKTSDPAAVVRHRMKLFVREAVHDPAERFQAA